MFLSLANLISCHCIIHIPVACQTLLSLAHPIYACPLPFSFLSLLSLFSVPDPPCCLSLANVIPVPGSLCSLSLVSPGSCPWSTPFLVPVQPCLLSLFGPVPLSLASPVPVPGQSYLLSLANPVSWTSKFGRTDLILVSNILSVPQERWRKVLKNALAVSFP
jgi:hypothetical protein